MSNGFLAKGYAVQRASREPAKLQGWLDGTKSVASIGATSPGAAIGGLAETAAWADIVVLAVKGLGAEDAVAAAGPANLAGKLVLDATNPNAVEALCILWCAPGFLRNDWAHAFKYLTPA